jgi:hypothetical protein
MCVCVVLLAAEFDYRELPCTTRSSPSLSLFRGEGEETKQTTYTHTHIYINKRTKGRLSQLGLSQDLTKNAPARPAAQEIAFDERRGLC